MTRTAAAWPGNLRRSPFIAEFVLLWLAMFADGLLNFVGRPDGDYALLAARAITMIIGAVIVTAVLIRHRFHRLVLTTAVASVASLVLTAGAVQAQALDGHQLVRPSVAEVLALAILTGTVCRSSTPRQVIPLTALAGIAMTLNPLLRPGVDSDWALLAVPAAVLWGASVGVGLVLRDADNLRRAEQLTAREAERVSLARELHDFVAHHVTGIVVLAQGAQLSASGNPAVLGEIEKAGTEALTAMRQLVGMLRTDNFATLTEGLKAAGGDDERIQLHAAELDGLPPELISTAHRITLEAVTNAQRYGEPGTTIDVTARPVNHLLVLQIANQVAQSNQGEQARGGGSEYGLVGMLERAQAVGGTLAAGLDPSGRWLVTATLPLAHDRNWI